MGPDEKGDVSYKKSVYQVQRHCSCLQKSYQVGRQAELLQFLVDRTEKKVNL